ncbi:conserved hypothetical protein [Aromatoleum aromaticum EbN1]|uniref:Thermostable hemolysin n=2 Tax=Aromatoleum aromaticum TaxID=551760 RepID=Q5NZ20_AROAE|nr:conserved hypothetical protein [Aromatoleum aromaticum EbN1]
MDCDAQMNSRNGCCYKAIARIGCAPSLTLRAVDGREPEGPCTAAQAFIRERFAARYGAQVRHFMPTLLQLEDDAGQLHGVVGVRSAADDKLFLERYLDRPIETEIARLSGLRPARERIVEVGNLAARGAGHARLLIVALADLLVAHGFDWVVFTGTAEVLNSVRRLHLSPLSLGDADPQRMGDEVADWGSYYATHPKLMAGDLRRGHERLTSKGVYHRLGHQRIFHDTGTHDAAVA